MLAILQAVRTQKRRTTTIGDAQNGSTFAMAKRGKERYSLTTPSWAEANSIAVEKLRAMNPDIAAALSLSRKKGPPQCFRCLADVVGSNGAEIW